VTVSLAAPPGARQFVEGRSIGRLTDLVPFDVPATGFTLSVSNQSFADDPVRITVLIDGQPAVDDLFAVGSQHNWVTYQLDIPAGTHEVAMASDTGVTATATFETPTTGQRYGVVNYWYYPPDPAHPGADVTPRSLEFSFAAEPIGFA
jgi:hypothetical protein